jgi:DNA processing protein
MAVPGPVSSEQSQGCHRLVQQGAKLVQRVDDILDELSPMYRSVLRAPEPVLSPSPGPTSLGEDETNVLAVLREDPEPMQLDTLVEKAPFGVARVHAALFALELRGLVEQLPGGYYLCRPSGETD